MFCRYYSIHWSACIFYFIARQHGLGTNTWIGRDMGLLERSSPFERCSFWSPGHCDTWLCHCLCFGSSSKVVPTATHCNICWRHMLQVYIGSVLEYDNSGHSRLWRFHRCAQVLSLPHALECILL